MKFPKVSIVMPSFNSSRFIHNSIRSVISQTYKDWELLIVDDCSTDDTYEIAKEYEKNDNRIKVFRNDNNRGAAYSRNFAIKNSSGEYIAFLDSDDKWRETKLEKQINFMLDNDYDFTYTNYDLINEEGGQVGLELNGPKKVTYKMMRRCCYPGCLTVIYKKSIFPDLEIPVDIKKRNDYALWILLAKKSNCYLLNECLASYRKVHNSISNVGKSILFKHHVLMFVKVFGYSKFYAYYRAFINVIYYFIKLKKYCKKVQS